MQKIKQMDLLKNKIEKIDGPWYYEMNELGYNYRITDFQCGMGTSQLKKLDQFVQKRRKIANIYDLITLPDAIHFDDQIKTDTFESLVNDTEIGRIKLFQEASKNRTEISIKLSELQSSWRYIK
mgnify:CR=1 FL=1